MKFDTRLHSPSFRFREKEIIRILAQWDAGNGVLLTGIRRTGKSELMKAALFRYSQQGQPVSYLDVQAEDNLAQFYQNLLTALLIHLPVTLKDQLSTALGTVLKLPDGLSRWVRQQISKVSIPEVVEIELQPQQEQLLRYWKPLTDQIAAHIKACGPLDTPVIGIDELPFMLENLMKKGVAPNEIVVMLASLRTLRDAGLRVIIGGSISFENLLSIHNIPHTVLGGLFRLPVLPFTRPEAQSYLSETLAGRFAATPEAVTLVLDNLPDYVPEVLKIAHGFLVTCENLDACSDSLSNEIMPGVRRAFLQQFDERLTKNYSSTELSCAEQILDAVALGDITGTRLDGRQLPSGYHLVLSRLQYDNFIVDAPDLSWRFSLNLIRLWWRASRGMA